MPKTERKKVGRLALVRDSVCLFLFINSTQPPKVSWLTEDVALIVVVSLAPLQDKTAADSAANRADKTYQRYACDQPSAERGVPMSAADMQLPLSTDAQNKVKLAQCNGCLHTL